MSVASEITAAAPTAKRQKTTVSTRKINVDPEEFPHLLNTFYQRLFPYSPYFKWLNYGAHQKNYFQHREFSFTLKDDVYCRYLSFQDQAEMTREIQKRRPYKIDIGAVFTGKPKDHKKIKASEFHPIERELVFDIDMTDYDEIRTCCDGAAICNKCWPFMTVAVKIMDAALREDFGFEHILWVYSGRRGIHAWVCDKRARQLSNSGRSAVAEYLQLIVGNKERKVNLGKANLLHPSVDRAVETAKSYFLNLVLAEDKQDVLRQPEDQKKMLAVIGDAKIQDELLESWSGEDETSIDRWQEMFGALTKKIKADTKDKKFSEFQHRAKEIVLQYTYPRLDIHVSKQMNHLLKSPFCVHPKTGRVCVPLDPDTAEDFDPFSVPTIDVLCGEIDEFDQTHDEETNRSTKGYMKTQLKDAIAIFEEFCDGLDEENLGLLRKAKEESEQSMDF